MKRHLFFSGWIPRHVLPPLLVMLLLMPVGGEAGRVLIPAAVSAGQEQSQRDIVMVRSVINAQAASWNRGDIEGFMKGYERSDETVFVSGDEVTRGWQTVFERYRRNYGSREQMGTLAFSDLEIKLLGPTAAVVLGRWRLVRAGGDNPHGRFTLIFRRGRQGWRIIHDHTSTAQKPHGGRAAASTHGL